MRSLWVAVLHVSGATERKINGGHQRTVDDVRDAVLCRTGLTYVWDEHPVRGTRALIKARVRDVDVLVVLYPDGNDPWGETYHLGSAYPR